MTRSLIAVMTAIGFAMAPAAVLAQTATPNSGNMEKGKMVKTDKSKHTGAHSGTTGSAAHKGGKAMSAPAGNAPDAGAAGESK